MLSKLQLRSSLSLRSVLAHATVHSVWSAREDFQPLGTGPLGRVSARLLGLARSGPSKDPSHHAANKRDHP